MKTSLCAVVCVAASWMAAESEAVTQEQLDLEAKRQARSVHLGWTDVPDGSQLKVVLAFDNVGTNKEIAQLGLVTAPAKTFVASVPNPLTAA